jgi:hypothetical protein
MASEPMPKRLELLSEVVGHTMPVALLVNPSGGSTESMILDMQEAARMKGVQLHVLKANNEAEIDALSRCWANSMPAGSSSLPMRCSTMDASISWL